MLLSKLLNFIAGFIMYGCLFVLTIGMICNVALHEVVGTKLYTVEAAIILVICCTFAAVLSNLADKCELNKFHNYCDRNKITHTLGNYNEYQYKLLNIDKAKKDSSEI